MTHRQVLAALLLVSCSWSNSLYHARRLAGEAERAERSGRSFEAESYWSQAAVKADSVLARSPGGSGAAEALWVRGRAAARLRDCASAIVSFDRALVAAPTASWREQLLLELGRCRETVGDPTAMQQFMALIDSPEPARRREARLRAGHLALVEQRWTEALALLAGQDSSVAHIDRAVALAALNRTAEALAEVEPLLVAADSLVGWESLVRRLAGQNSADADRLLARLAAQPGADGVRRAGWLLAAIQGGLTHDPISAERHFAELAELPPSPMVGQGRLLMAEHRVSQATSMAGLRSALEALGPLSLGGGLATIRIGELRRLGGRMVAEADSLAAGAPRGDLALFALAEDARDSLAAPSLAVSLLARLERDWPASPYAAKALLVRMALTPDSADALRQRLRERDSSPYLGFSRGELDPRFAQLEDSLSAFLGERVRRRAAASVPVINE